MQLEAKKKSWKKNAGNKIVGAGKRQMKKKGMKKAENWICQKKNELLENDEFSVCASDSNTYTNKEEFCQKVEDDDVSFIHFGTCGNCAKENVCQALLKKQEKVQEKKEKVQEKLESIKQKLTENESMRNKKKNKQKRKEKKMMKKMNKINKMNKKKNEATVTFCDSNGDVKQGTPCAYLIEKCEQFKNGVVLKRGRGKDQCF